jgi:hypothetical protein
MSKYGNRKIKVDGITFDSIREANRYQELKLAERAGAIKCLSRQVTYKLIPAAKTRTGKTVQGISYVADFVYLDDQGREVVEDVKGFRTDVYKIKKKLMLWLYGIEIQEV